MDLGSARSSDEGFTNTIFVDFCQWLILVLHYMNKGALVNTRKWIHL